MSSQPLTKKIKIELCSESRPDNTDYVTIDGNKFESRIWYLNTINRQNHTGPEKALVDATEQNRAEIDEHILKLNPQPDYTNYPKKPHLSSATPKSTSPQPQTNPKPADSPPVFDRIKFVQEIHAKYGIKAAIASTYCFNLSSMVAEYPTLFAPGATIPTMLIHGEPTAYSCVKLKSAVVHKTPGPLDENNDPHFEDKDRKQTPTADDPLVKVVFRYDSDAFDGRRRSPDIVISNNCVVNFVFCSWAEKWGYENMTESFNNNVKMECKNTENSNISFTEDEVKNKRRLGVHHPKYLLLFTEDKLFVVIGTANFGGVGNIEGSYVCMFNRGENMAPKPPDGIETDFGKVMANFLYCEDKCFKKHGGRVWRGELPNTQSVNDFLTSHVKDGIASVEDFSQKYNWHEAKCRLIATAPGDHAGQISKSNKFVYGSQAVANALATCGEQNKWRKVQSKGDKVILQPTSMGVRVDGQFGVNLGRNMHGKDKRHEENEDDCDNDEILRDTKVIWPTMNRAIESSNEQRIHGNGVMTNLDGLGSSFTCMWDAKSFNQSGAGDFLATCLAKWEPSTDFDDLYYEGSTQNNNLRMMHIKSYYRTIGNSYTIREYLTTDDADEGDIFLYTWTMLTSSCMSRGAQGFPMEGRGLEDDRQQYSNFELGVFFTSDFSADDTKEHVVYASGRNFDGYEHHNKHKVIRVPVPFNMDAPLYCEPGTNDYSECPLFSTHDDINIGYASHIPPSNCTCVHCAKKTRIHNNKTANGGGASLGINNCSIEDLCKAQKSYITQDQDNYFDNMEASENVNAHGELLKQYWDDSTNIKVKIDDPPGNNPITIADSSHNFKL